MFVAVRLLVMIADTCRAVVNFILGHLAQVY